MSTRPLRLGGVPEHFNLPWHLAMAAPACGGLSLTWQDQPGGTGEMLARLADGDLDMVSILTEGTVAAIDRGAPLTVIQVYVATPLQWGVFVPAASAFQDIGQLREARIAISRLNSGSHLMAFILSEPQGWTPSDDQFVVVGGLDGAVEAFDDGRADLFLWEQHMTRPLVTAGRFRQLGVVETPWPSFVIAARNEVLTGRTSEVGAVVDAVVAEARGLHDRPDVVELITGRYGLTAETARSWLATTSYAERGPMDPAIAKKVLDTLASAGFN